jgi:hypothetical protein
MALLALAAAAALALALAGDPADAKGGSGKSKPAATASTPQTAVQIAVNVPLPPPLPDPVFTGDKDRIHQFDVTGFLQNATVDGSLCPDLSANQWGGTAIVNSIKYVIPCNTILQMPAAAFTWADLFNASAFPPGLALAAATPVFPSVEIRLVGNMVDGQNIAGLVFISQQSLNMGAGIITGFDYANGVIFVGADDGAGQVRVQLNDPNGRFSKGQSSDERFAADDENPTVKSTSGYPMCVPRIDPALASDPLCPQRNRPLAVNGCRNFAGAGVFSPAGWELSAPRANQTYCTAFVMGDPIRSNGTKPDSRQQAPFEVGDYVNFAGTLIHDGLGPNGSDTVSAHTISANLGIFTEPGTLPVYLAIGAFGVSSDDSAGATAINGAAQDAQGRIFLEASVTDVTTVVDLYFIDADPVSGEERNRWITPEAMTEGVNPGAQPYLGGISTQLLGAQPGRARFRANRVAPGILASPTRNVRVVARSLCTPDIVNSQVRTGAGAIPPLGNGSDIQSAVGIDCLERDSAANGLFAGQFVAPVFEFIFPENLMMGDPIVPNDFWSYGFLANGEGPGTGPLIPQPW